MITAPARIGHPRPLRRNPDWQEKRDALTFNHVMIKKIGGLPVDTVAAAGDWIDGDPIPDGVFLIKFASPIEDGDLTEWGQLMDAQSTAFPLSSGEWDHLFNAAGQVVGLVGAVTYRQNFLYAMKHQEKIKDWTVFYPEFTRPMFEGKA